MSDQDDFANLAKREAQTRERLGQNTSRQPANPADAVQVTVVFGACGAAMLGEMDTAVTPALMAKAWLVEAS